ncbi:unnamed protein product [Symbiodinium sp. KB8]|nr:unnamed protein product [Symbiodinium sp. KB8]
MTWSPWDAAPMGGEELRREGLRSGFPFKWAKTRGGFRVEWLGMETEYPQLEARTFPEARYLALRVAPNARPTWLFAAIALDWERPFLGPLDAWSSAVHGSRLAHTNAPHDRPEGGLNLLNESGLRQNSGDFVTTPHRALWIEREKPAPPPQVAVAPPPPPQGSVEALRARRQLADIVRNNAEVMLALQLRKNTDDRAIVRALAKVRDLFELLRQAGCSIVQATRAEELMELAIEAPDVKPPKRSRARYFYGAAGVIVFVIFLLVAIIVLEVSQSSQGWEVGTCSMTLFHNQTCFQDLLESALRSGDNMVLLQTPLERRGDFFPGWAVELNAFAPGDVVFLDTGSTAGHHHAVVVSRPEEPGVICSALQHDELVVGLSRRTSMPQQNRKVALQIDGLLVHVPCRRLVRVVPPRRVLVVHDTFSYRRLARTQVGQDDGVVELGSSLGECTHILSSRAAAVIGIEVSQELVEESSRRYPDCRFEWLDCFQEQARFAALCKELLAAGSGRLKIFVDIGGDRTTSDICCLLALLEKTLKTLQPKLPPLPALVVVKSKALATAAAEAAGADGTIPEPELRPWLEGIARKQPGSSKQLKKKLARARKAQWQQADDTAWQAFEKQRIKWDALCNEEQAHLKSELRKLKQEHPEAWGETLNTFLTERLGTSKKKGCVSSALSEMGRCLVEVAVRSGTFFGSKNPWALPIVHVGGRGEIARYQGDPFRCCNDMEGYVGSCCDLVAGGVSALTAQSAVGATRNRTFCDSWGILGRTDHMGETCDCSALMPARQDDDADLYDPDDPASDWGQVVQEAALEEARKKRQRNCKGWIQERTASLQEKWQRISKCIRRGKKKEPESPASGRGEAKVRRMTSKSSQGRGASQSVVRSSSKLSRGSRGSRGRSPSKGFQGTGRAESKSSRGSRGVDSDDRSDAPLEEDEDEQEESQPAKSETRKVSATISKEVPEVFEEKRATAACFPPGFVWHDGADPTLVDNLEKYLKWEATGKELEDVEERDIHPGFHTGNLRGMARLARQQHQSLLLPIVEPMTGRSAKSHSYSADTLYYSCSTLRESRRKKRKRGAMKGPGGKQAARALAG